MRKVQSDIKEKNFKNIYLLCGEEAYLRNYYKNALKNALTDPDDTLNYSYFEGASTDKGEVISLMETMPFIAERRVIIVENSGWFSKASKDDSDEEPEDMKETKSSAGDGLIAALENLMEEVIVIFAEEKADKRSALYKLITKKGTVEEYPFENEETLTRWVASYVSGAGKRMSPKAASYLVSEVGTNMYALSLEAEKLIAWCLEREEITVDDIDNVCTHQVTNKIFDMISYISAGRRKEALSLYYNLLTLRESPFHILALMVRQYNQMLEVKSLINKGKGIMEIASVTGTRDWLVRKISESVRRVSEDDIKECLKACCEADEGIKSGNISDTFSIELLIIKCATRQSA